MDGVNLTAKQAEIVHKRLADSERYLTSLRDRMLQLGFTVDDRLFRKVYVAQVTVRDLREELHARAYSAYYAK